MNLFPTLPPDIIGFLLLIASVPGVLLSQLEKWPWFAALSPTKKLIFQLAASGIAAVLATLIGSGVLPPDALKSVNTIYVLIIQIITGVVANQTGHVSINMLAKPVGASLQAKADKIAATQETTTTSTSTAQMPPTVVMTVTPPDLMPMGSAVAGFAVANKQWDDAMAAGKDITGSSLFADTDKIRQPDPTPDEAKG